MEAIIRWIGRSVLVILKWAVSSVIAVINFIQAAPAVIADLLSCVLYDEGAMYITAGLIAGEIYLLIQDQEWLWDPPVIGWFVGTIIYYRCVIIVFGPANIHLTNAVFLPSFYFLLFLACFIYGFEFLRIIGLDSFCLHRQAIVSQHLTISFLNATLI